MIFTTNFLSEDNTSRRESDFRSSEVSQPEFKNFGKLEARTICGTPEYIAPEVIQGHKYNHTVDYYGLGLLIFEMIAGYNPYKVHDFADNPNLMFEIIINQSMEFTFPKKSFSSEAKSICKQLLAKQPKRRLGNGASGVEDIKKHPFFAGIDWKAL